jgi:hypothetical protein
MNRLSISPENEILHSFHHQVQNDHDAGRLHSTGLGVGFRHDIDRHEGEIRDDGLPCSADADTSSLHILSEWLDNLCCVDHSRHNSHDCDFCCESLGFDSSIDSDGSLRNYFRCNDLVVVGDRHNVVAVHVLDLSPYKQKRSRIKITVHSTQSETYMECEYSSKYNRNQINRTSRTAALV